MTDEFDNIPNSVFIQDYLTFEHVNKIKNGEEDRRTLFLKKCKTVQQEEKGKVQQWKPKDKWKFRLLTLFIQITDQNQDPDRQELFKTSFLESYQILAKQIKLFLEMNNSTFEISTSTTIKSIKLDFIETTTSPEHVKNSFNSIDKVFNNFFFLVYCAFSVIGPYTNTSVPTSSSLSSKHYAISRYFRKFERDFSQFGLAPEVLFNEFAEILNMSQDERPNFGQLFSKNNDDQNSVDDKNASNLNTEEEPQVIFGTSDSDIEEFQDTKVDSFDLSTIDSLINSIIISLNNLIKTFNGFLSALRDQLFNLQCHWFDLFLQSAILIPSRRLITHDIFELFTAPSIKEAETQEDKDKLREQTFVDLLSIIQNSKSLISLSEFSNALISIYDKTISSLVNQCSLITLLNVAIPTIQNPTLLGNGENDIDNMNENIEKLTEHVNNIFSPCFTDTKFKPSSWYRFSKSGSALIHKTMGTDFTVEKIYDIISETINKFQSVDLQLSEINEFKENDINRNFENPYYSEEENEYSDKTIEEEEEEEEGEVNQEEEEEEENSEHQEEEQNPEFPSEHPSDVNESQNSEDPNNQYSSDDNNVDNGSDSGYQYGDPDYGDNASDDYDPMAD